MEGEFGCMVDIMGSIVWYHMCVGKPSFIFENVISEST